MSRLRIAAAQYDIGCFTDFDAYADKLGRWIGEAAEAGADLLVFPEYGAMELVSLFDEATRRNLATQLHVLGSLLPDFLALHRDLAMRHGVHVCAASFPIQAHEGGYRNRVHLFTPDGVMGFQDKLIMTRFETERWGIGAGDTLRVFETALGHFGINICYDCEFPLLARAQVEAGAEFLLVPSCTDGLAGYYRVRIACQARALESQCYVIQAPTVGEAPWSEAVDVNVGAAGVFAPPDRGFPDDSVVALGTLNEPGWLYADIDLTRVATVRTQGHVLNHRDWDAQVHARVRNMERVVLR